MICTRDKLRLTIVRVLRALSVVDVVEFMDEFMGEFMDEPKLREARRAKSADKRRHVTENWFPRFTFTENEVKIVRKSSCYEVSAIFSCGCQSIEL